MRHERETSRDARRLSNALVTHELLTDRMSAIERRQNKLAGTVYRDRRTDQGDARGEGDMSGEHEIKGFENLDPRFEAMVALQNASRAP